MAAPARGRKKILVVDDEADFVDIMKQRFKVKGYDVLTANNGMDALNTFRKEKPDAVLLDVMMPQLDGLSVLKEIRAADPTLPVFITTAYSNEERVKVAGSLNASGFILKGQANMSQEVENIVRMLESANKLRSDNA